MGSETMEKLRSRTWFDNPDNPEKTALYMGRYLNYWLSRAMGPISRGES